MEREILKRVCVDQREDLERMDSGTARHALALVRSWARLAHIVVVAGIRRAGKSTLLKQVMKQVYPKGDYYYLNFADERLMAFGPADFDALYEVFLELYGDRRAFFFDEIQMVEGWEQFVRRMCDKKMKIYLTGSNATLMRKDLGTRLTGRHLTVVLHPFSFREFLEFRGIQLPPNWNYSTVTRARIKRMFNAYLYTGGMPEYLKYGEKEMLKMLYDDILYRDIVAAHRLDNVRELRELAFYLISHIGSRFTYNSLRKTVGLKSVTSAKDYVGHLRDSFLLDFLFGYDRSLKRQFTNEKKVYCVDTGIADAIGFRASGDRGHFLENVVHSELKRRGHEVYFYTSPSGLETDFLVIDRRKPAALVQVAYTLSGAETRKRELTGLMDAMADFGLRRGLILTDNEEETVRSGKRRIDALPAMKWLLGEG